MRLGRRPLKFGQVEPTNDKAVVLDGGVTYEAVRFGAAALNEFAHSFIKLMDGLVVLKSSLLPSI